MINHYFVTYKFASHITLVVPASDLSEAIRKSSNNLYEEVLMTHCDFLVKEYDIGHFEITDAEEANSYK